LWTKKVHFGRAAVRKNAGSLETTSIGDRLSLLGTTFWLAIVLVNLFVLPI
jgi:hypothetical protein